jgi:hypothetical protein
LAIRRSEMVFEPEPKGEKNKKINQLSKFKKYIFLKPLQNKKGQKIWGT